MKWVFKDTGVLLLFLSTFLHADGVNVFKIMDSDERNNLFSTNIRDERPCFPNPCQNEGSCTLDDQNNFKCECNPPFVGETCETKCQCYGDHEICSFVGENKQCKCETGFAKKNGVCTVICSKDSECGENEKCKGKEGSKSCECADGLGGENCDKKNWCESNGKFKNCQGVNGTCEYVKEKRAVDCLCPPGKLLDNSINENRCKDTCSTSARCQNGGTCMDNFCFCFPGYIGDRCEIVFDCTDKGKLQGCSKTGGACVLQGSKAVCNCPVDQKYHDKEHACKECTCGPHGTCKFVNGEKKCDCNQSFGDKEGICRATCSTPADCNDNQICSTVNNFKTCLCASGLSGNFCEKLSWCDTRFKNCKGANGTCEYVKDKRSVDCTCGPGKALDKNENRCRETCSSKADCKNKGKCENNFCLCNEGFVGDKCETIFDCTAEGKYKFCEMSGGTCSHDDSNTVCSCPNGKKLHETENICKECNCGPYGTCSFIDGQKKCDCHSFAIEKNGVCVVIETTSREFTTVAASTIMPSTPPDCYCGENSESCHFNWKSGKVCKCSSGYAQRFGFCYECNCGINSYSCYYRRNGTKVCNCDFGFDQVNGYCTAICNEDKCVHGKCEEVKNGFKCRCNEGFTGQRCEEKIQTKLVKEDLWRILQVSVGIATFIMLCGFLCSISRRLSKMSNK